MMKLAKMFGIGVALLASGCAGTAEPGSAEEGNAEDLGSTEEALSAQTMVTNEYLFSGQRLYSANCSYYLAMTTSGKLEVRDRNDGFVWAAGTSSTGAWAAIQGDGNFVAYPRDGGAPGTALWSTQTISGVKLVLQGDSNLLLLNSNGNLVWKTGTVRSKAGDCSIPQWSQVTYVQNNTTRISTGPEIVSFPTTSKGACGNQCAVLANCSSWFFEGAPKMCHLKSGSVGLGSPQTGTTSGIKRKFCNGTGCTP
jgi:hypothetical protein